jgi:propionyl-CoA carboxylase alpha subunit
VSSQYDSLLAKVIAHAPTRDEAAARIGRSMRSARIAGVRTNADMLAATMSEDDYLAARTPTAYLDEHPEVLAAAGPAGDDRLALVLGVVVDDEHADRTADGVTGFAPSGWRNLRTRGQRRIWEVRGEPEHIEYVVDGAAANVLVGPWPEPLDDGTLPDDARRLVRVRLLDRRPGRQVVELDGHRHAIEVRWHGDVAVASSAAGTLELVRPPRFVDHDADESTGGPVCPLPGTVIAVHVEAGQRVAEGELLMVVEAMKMEHRITAAVDATIVDVRFAVGDRVDAGDLLVELAAVGHDAAEG